MTYRHAVATETLLRDAGILPVITVDSVDQARRLADALLAGGLTALERRRDAIVAGCHVALKPRAVAVSLRHRAGLRAMPQAIDGRRRLLETPGRPSLAGVLGGPRSRGAGGRHAIEFRP